MLSHARLPILSSMHVLVDFMEWECQTLNAYVIGS